MRFAILFSVLFTATFASAEVTIRILDLPQSALVYSPTYVTLAIENRGPEAELIPVNESNRNNRWFVELGKMNDGLGSVPDIAGYGVGDKVIWLRPGERHLLQKEIGMQLVDQGLYQVQAGLVSDGRCELEIKGNESYQLNRIEHYDWKDVYECWKGDVRSAMATVSVSNPSSAVEKEVLINILQGKYVERAFNRPDTNIAKFSESYEYLKENFPNSYYTYVAGFYQAWSFSSAPGTLEEIMKAQPNHTLSTYARMEWVLGVLWRSFNPEYEDFIRDRRARVKEIQLPPVLMEYVQQRKGEWEVAKNPKSEKTR